MWGLLILEVTPGVLSLPDSHLSADPAWHTSSPNLSIPPAPTTAPPEGTEGAVEEPGHPRAQQQPQLPLTELLEPSWWSRGCSGVGEELSVGLVLLCWSRVVDQGEHSTSSSHTKGKAPDKAPQILPSHLDITKLVASG